MADVPLHLVPEDGRHPWGYDLNPIVRLLRAVNTGGVALRGDLGTRRDLTDPNRESAGHYTAAIQSKAAGGRHAAFVLSSTAVSAAPTIANSAVLIEDSGLVLGASARLDAERIRVYEPGRVDYSEATSSNGELVLAGSGANAGGLALGPAPLRLAFGAAAQWFNAANTLAGQIAATAAGDLATGGSGARPGRLILGSDLQLPSGGRIAGDFSNGTASARTLAQTTTANQGTVVGAIPNGTATTAGWAAYNGSDPNNAGALQLAAMPTAMQLIATATGAGVAQPLVLTAGLAQLTLTQAGDIAMTAPYGTWTPGVSQAGARTVSGAVGESRVFGKFAHVKVSVTVTNAGTAGNAIQITGVPAALAAAATGIGHPIGTMMFFDQSASAFYSGVAVFTSATTIEALRDGAAGFAVIGVDPSIALAANDIISGTFTYRLA